MERHGDLWAMAQTNLGLSLLEHLKLQPLIDSQTVDYGVEEAIAHFDAALKWRSFDRDPLDWAFTEINLGLAFARQRSGDRRTHLLRALDHFESAAKGFEASGAVGLQAQALHNISSSRLDLAHLDDTDAHERGSLLARAEEAARSSLQVRGLAEAPIDAGRSWDALARALAALGDRSGAIDAYRHALEGLTPWAVPRECRTAARVLAAMASEDGNWRLAADAWETAAEAAAVAFESRATGEGRFAEVRENLNIFRWAAYALTRVGRLERAVEVLELGRARQLAAWMQLEAVQLDQLGHLDPTLRDRFVEFRSRLDESERSSPAGGYEPMADIGQIAERFRATIEEIRALPSLGSFYDRPRFADIALAALPGVPIAYLVTAPEGSVALIVWADGKSDPGPRVEAVDIGGLTSTEVVQLLIKVDLATDAVDGYIAAQVGESENLDRFLAELGALVGQRLLKPLSDTLKARRASAVCLVPITLMGLLPLHALQWRESHETRCLVDDFDVIFSPSAIVRAICLDRASMRSRERRRMLAVGNPLPHPQPLEGAESEVEIVVQAFPSDFDIEVLAGVSATKAAVVHGLPGASYVHLACHGWADSREDALSAVLSLADEETLSAREIVDLDGVVARLVVASACQTGVVQGYETADEGLGLATAFVGAGAAGVIASLWLVDDYATALLMSRLYELLVPIDEAGTLGPDPAGALRAAQLWLRRLTLEDEEVYLHDRPALRAHRERSAQRTGWRVGESHASLPYSALEYWAPFVFIGA